MPRVSREQAKLNHERVVEVAATLFRERGLNGIGVADLMAAAGLTHGGFYKQFASRDALVAEALAHALGKYEGADFTTFVEGYLSDQHVANAGRGCPLVALVNDVSREATDNTVRHHFTNGVRGIVERLADLTPLGSQRRRRQRALATFSTLIGAVALARAVDDSALRSEILESARNCLLPRSP